MWLLVCILICSSHQRTYVIWTYPSYLKVGHVPLQAIRQRFGPFHWVRNQQMVWRMANKLVEWCLIIVHNLIIPEPKLFKQATGLVLLIYCFQATSMVWYNNYCWSLLLINHHKTIGSTRSEFGEHQNLLVFRPEHPWMTHFSVAMLHDILGLFAVGGPIDFAAGRWDGANKLQKDVLSSLAQALRMCKTLEFPALQRQLLLKAQR